MANGESESAKSARRFTPEDVRAELVGGIKPKRGGQHRATGRERAGCRIHMKARNWAESRILLRSRVGRNLLNWKVNLNQTSWIAPHITPQRRPEAPSPPKGNAPLGRSAAIPT